MKKIFVAFAALLLFFFSNYAYAYNWPFPDRTGPHPIVGTLGEYRKDHLHAGVDMKTVGTTRANAEQINVIAIEGCNYSSFDKRGTDNEYLECGSFKYQHISVSSNFLEGEAVMSGDVIGTLKWLPSYENVHLHLEENGGAENPLRAGGIHIYEDGAATTANRPEFLLSSLGTNGAETLRNARVTNGVTDKFRGHHTYFPFSFFFLPGF